MNPRATLDYVARRSAWLPLLALLGATFLAVACYLYVPSKVDGGWYAYPALALAEGRDPGDNQMSMQELRELHDGGTKIKYYWDSRRNLYVVPAAWWFETFGAGFLSTRLLSVSHLLLYLGASFWLLRRYGGDARIAIAVWVLLATDTEVISSGVADMRPDLLMAGAAILMFMALHGAAAERRGHVALVAAASLFLAFTYPLIHLTAPFTMAILWASVLGRWWWESRPMRSAYPAPWVWIALVVMVVVFALRRPLLDLLIPTRVAEPYAQSAFAALLKNLHAGPLAYVLREIKRWSAYGSTSNVFVALVALSGAAIWVSRLVRDRHNIGGFDRGLLVGVGGAVVLVAICSPYPREDHLITLVPFVLLAASRGLSWLVRDQSRNWLVAALVLVAAGTCAVKVAHALHVRSKAVTAHFDNHDVLRAFASIIPVQGQTVIVGPAEIWPYLNRRADVVIFDDRAGSLTLAPDVARVANLLIVNSDYRTYGWPERFLAKNPGLHVKLRQEFGRPSGGPYLAIYEFVDAEASP